MARDTDHDWETREALFQALHEARYTSSQDGRQRGFQEHHIEVILAAIDPILTEAKEAAYREGRMDEADAQGYWRK